MPWADGETGPRRLDARHLVLPLVAWLIVRRNSDERRQRRGVRIAIAIYALVVVATLVSAFSAA